MDKIIVITNANMNTSSGNITLLLRRAESMYSLYNYVTEIIVYHGVSQDRITSTEEYYSISYLNTKKELFDVVEKVRPRYIIIYGVRLGVLSYRLHRIIQKNQIPCKILMDVQSCIEEKWEYAKGLKNRITYPISLLLFRLTISNVDGAFVVSDELKDNCRSKTLWAHELEFYKIRCGINDIPSFVDIKYQREMMRRRFSITEDCVVFVYSGYRMPWQKVDEIIEEFKEYDKILSKTFFMFFCNTDSAFEDQLRSSFPKGNYCVKLLGKEEYQATLCGCDIGYILRDYKETNRVAFPNKFSDYLSAGLLIALNKSLPEPLRVLTGNNLQYIDTDDSITKKIALITSFQDKRDDYIRDALEVCFKELLYDNQFNNIQI